MAHKYPANTLAERQLLINAAPLVSDYAGVGEVSVELKFSDPEGKQQPSPRGVVFAPDMHAYFHFTCPMRDCTGGGYDPSADLLQALKKRRDGHGGVLGCQGVRPRSGIKNKTCGIELHYTLAIRREVAAA